MLALPKGRPAVRASLRRATGVVRDDPAAAARTLHRVLTRLDPAAAPADEDLVSVVVLYTDCLPDCDADDVELLLPWCRYAATTSRLLHGPAHLTTTDALASLIWVLEIACVHDGWPPDLTHELVHTWTALIKANTVLLGPYALGTLTARVHRALARHRLGHCRRTVAEMIRIWTLHQRHHGVDDAIILCLAWNVLHACGAHDRKRSWLAKHLVGLSNAAMDAAIDVYGDPDFSSPVDIAGHRRVCTYPRPRRAPARKRPTTLSFAATPSTRRYPGTAPVPGQPIQKGSTR